MPEELTLFEETRTQAGLKFTPAARLTDPETSRLAAEARPEGKTSDRARVLDHLKDVWPAGLTDYELAALMDRQQNSVGKRRSELVALGLVEWAGTHRPAPSGSPCRVWRYVK